MTIVNGYRTLIPIEKCTRCGYREMKCSLHVHHLDGDRNNNNIDNLLVLCANCHYSLHHNLWNITELGIYVAVKIRERKVKEVKPIVINHDELNNNLIIKNLESKVLDSNSIIKNLESKIELMESEALYFEESQDAISRESSFDINKRILLFSYLHSTNYRMRDFVVFMMEKIPNTWFNDVHHEFDMNNQLILKCIQLVFDKYYTRWKRSSSEVFPINPNLDDFIKEHYSTSSES